MSKSLERFLRISEEEENDILFMWAITGSGGSLLAFAKEIAQVRWEYGMD